MQMKFQHGLLSVKLGALVCQPFDSSEADEGSSSPCYVILLKIWFKIFFLQKKREKEKSGPWNKASLRSNF